MWWSLIQFSAGSIVWGVLIAALCMALFVFLIRGWWKDAEFSPVTYVVGAVLFVLLAFQCILICGSVKIISMANTFEIEATHIVDNFLPKDQEVSMVDADTVIKTLISEFPVLGHYIGGGEFSGFTAAQLPHAIAEELRSFMKWYIVRRLLWCLGFVVVAAVIGAKTITMTRKTASRSRALNRPTRGTLPRAGGNRGRRSRR